MVQMPLTLPLADPAGIFSVVLAIMLVAPFLAERVRLPGIVGLALAGILVGPNVLNVIARDSTIEFLGSIGLMYVFFVAGVEIDLSQLRREKGSTLVFYAFTFGLPFAVGMATGIYIFRMGFLSALLFGCVFSSYTLISYPIVSKLGLTRQRSAVAAVSAVILTDTTTMLILGAVARASRGGESWLDWARMGGAIAAWAVACVLVVPRAADLFFKKVKPDGTIEFVFSLALVFLCAFTSRLAGLEPIIGAFVAGLLLNRFIPESGVLMNRVRFAGDSLFIPFFMVYIGVLADPSSLVEHPATLVLALAMVALNIAAKWLAAEGSGRLLGYSRHERGMLFGLSVNHAAAVLAAALVGFKLGLFDQAVLNGAIFLIIASCLIGPMATQRAGKALAASCEDRQAGSDRSLERILVAISNPQSIRELLDLAFLLRGRRSEEAVYPLAVVRESSSSGLEIAKAENHLAQAVVQGVSAGVPVIPSTRISVNVSEGILQAALEDRAGAIVIGWNRAPKLSHAFFGSVIEQVILGAKELVVVARLAGPLNNASTVSLVVPPLVERHPGFRRGLALLTNLVSQKGARLVVYAQKPHGSAVREALLGVKGRAHGQVIELDSWKAYGLPPGPVPGQGQAFALFSARPGEAAWHPAAEKLPHRLGEERPDLSLLLFYLPEGDGVVPAVPEPAPSPEGDLFSRSLAEGRVIPRLEGAAINDAIRELLRCSFPDDRRALSRLVSLFTEIAQKQPIELSPGVLLLHAHVDDVFEPLVFFGARPEGLRLLSLESPARLVVILCAPASQKPEAHLRTLGEIATLLKDDRVARAMGLADSD
jgi:Kef-type K+ transport system membrane component KefB/nucleotide-binding universal stress UspA family protein